jgi:hypothetical protein
MSFPLFHGARLEGQDGMAFTVSYMVTLLGSEVTMMRKPEEAGFTSVFDQLRLNGGSYRSVSMALLTPTGSRAARFCCDAQSSHSRMW